MYSDRHDAPPDLRPPVAAPTDRPGPRHVRRAGRRASRRHDDRCRGITCGSPSGEPARFVGTTPTARLVATIDIPAPQVSSVAFAGPRPRTLVITTSVQDLTAGRARRATPTRVGSSPSSPESPGNPAALGGDAADEGVRHHRAAAGRGARGRAARRRTPARWSSTSSASASAAPTSSSSRARWQYLHPGHAEYPMRIGHEWMGTVAAVGEGVDPAWIGSRVTGDTMLGCGACRRCRRATSTSASGRYELGIRGGARRRARRTGRRAGHGRCIGCRTSVDDTAGALVEPGGNALRAVDGAEPRSRRRALVLGPGTIGLLAAHVRPRRPGPRCTCSGARSRSLAFARSLGFDDVVDRATLPAPAVGRGHRGIERPPRSRAGRRARRARAARRVRRPRRHPEPDRHPTPGTEGRHGRRRAQRVAGPGGHDRAYATGRVDPRPLVAATVGLDEVAGVLAGSDRRAPGGTEDPRRPARPLTSGATRLSRPGPA